MELGFLFWLFGIGIIIASMTDLKRREVDNWLNSFLFVSGLAFVLFGAVLEKDFGIVLRMGLLVAVMFLIMNLFYYGRVFAGGDAKLLFAMSALFLGATILDSIINVGVFLFFLMVSGSVYGLIYSGVLWCLNWKKVNKEMRKLIFKNKWFFWIVGLSVVLMLLGFVNFIFLFVGGCLFVFPFLYVFAKGLENVSMIREVSGDKLREGDWLVEDVRVGKKIIRVNWDGLSLKEIGILKGEKKILIKEGLPFVPAFLFAFLGYVFLRGWFISLFLFV